MMFRSVFQGTIIRNEPAYRPRPVTMPGYHRFSGGDYDAFVALGALEAIAEQARRAAPNEMIGYLVGRPFRDARGSYAVVTEAVFAESARCGPVTVETTLDDEQRLLATLQADHPLAERLGWFHSHPFFMPNYSSTDLENQRFWSESYQLGLLACLASDGSVSVFAFRGPESEAVHPSYAASCSPHPNGVPALQSEWGTEHEETTPTMAQPTKQTGHQQSGLALLVLVAGVVWPIIYLIGVGMIVQAVREGREGAARTVPTSAIEAAKPAASKGAAPVNPTGQPHQTRQ